MPFQKSKDPRNKNLLPLREVKALVAKEKEGFNQGVAYATKILIDHGEGTYAREIWEASGCTLRGVDEYDKAGVMKLKRMIKKGSA